MLEAIADFFLQYKLGFLVFVSVAVLLRFAKWFLTARIKRLVEKSSNTIDDFLFTLIESWDNKVILVISAYFGMQFISASSKTVTVIEKSLLFIIGLYLVLSLQKLLRFLIRRYIDKRKLQEEQFDETIMLFLQKALSILLWVMALLVFLQNLGFQLTAILGGLGIGGIAIAFAVQSILEDVFSSISIYFDRPFKIGDFIVIGTDSGTVQKIGIKSTRIKTLQGEELIVSNKELTQSRVQNFKKMSERRIVFEFSVEYETAAKKLEKIPKLVKQIFEKTEMADLGRVHFKNLGESSLVYEVVYHVKSSEYLVYMDTQQEVNLSLLKSFEKEGIKFAYPTKRIVK